MKELDVKVGYSCNNVCVFCLNKDKRNECPSFPLDAIKRQILKSASDGCEKFIVSGGEPLISPFLFEILDLAKAQGIKYIEIQTNGRGFYYEELAKRMNQYMPMGFLLSLHFPNAELYKEYCGSDGFDQVVKGIKNLLKNGHSINVNTVIMKQNLAYLKELAGLLSDIGVTKFNYRFIDGHNVEERYEEFVPTYSEAVPIILDVIRSFPKMQIGLNEIPLCVIGEEFAGMLAPAPKSERDNLCIGNNTMTDKQIIEMQFAKPNCDGCRYYDRCKGIRQEYLFHYGRKELKPFL